MRAVIGVVVAVVAFGALVVGWAYVHRDGWYRQDFAVAFQRRIESELIPGQSAEFDRASLTVREVGRGQRLVCETVRVREGERETGRFHYAVQFWPTLFGGGATDMASPRVAGAGDLDRNQPIC